MKPLVQSALEYIADNLQEIILLPIDMSCMNSVLVRQLASIVDVAILETLNDRKDKLRSKLYMKKLEVTFEDEQNYLVRCVLAGLSERTTLHRCQRPGQTPARHRFRLGPQ